MTDALSTACEQLDRLAAGESDAWQNLASRGFLHRGLQAALDPDRAEDPAADLERCWAALTTGPQHLQDHVTTYYDEEAPGAPVDTARLIRNAAALVAAARAALIARRLWEGGCTAAERGDLLGWVGRTAEALAPADAPDPAALTGDAFDLSWTGQHGPVDVIDAACSLLGRLGLPVMPARFWIRHRLRGAPTPDFEPQDVRIAGVATDADPGRLYDLRLARYALPAAADRDGERAVLFEHPDGALRPLGPDLLAALQTAATDITVNISWLIVPAKPIEDDGRMATASADDGRPIEGDSLGGAAVAGIRALCERQPIDRSCLITAKLAPDGRTLQGVGGEYDKLRAARRWGVTRGVVAEGADLREGTGLREDQVAQLRAEGMIVERAATVERATELATGQDTGLLTYADWLLAGRDDPRDLPVYLNGRRPDDLYVEPDVLTREAAPIAEDELDRRAGRGPGRAGGRRDDDDDGGAYGIRQERERERRQPWTAVRDALPPGGRILLIADPGQGKTTLTRREARQLAQELRKSLLAQRGGLATLPLPIVVRLPVLAKHAHAWAGSGKGAETALREALTAALRDERYPERAVRYLADHAHEGRVWLYLDALDEVLSEHRETLLGVLTALREARWACRVVVTTRPGGEDVLLGQDRHILARFTPAQAGELITNWFTAQTPEAESARERVTAILREPAMEEMAASPFLLTLLCYVVEGHGTTELDGELTRARLYNRVVRDLVGLPKDQAGKVDEKRATALLPLLENLAFYFFQIDAGRSPMRYADILRLIARDEEYEPGKRFRDLLPLPDPRPSGGGLPPVTAWAQLIVEELERKRVLVPVGPERDDERAYVFPHRSILEYLTARALADRLIAETREGEATRS